MPYDEKFFRKYETYLLEPAVRIAHNSMFDLFHKFVGGDNLRVLDLGCGTSEFKRHSYCQYYAGIDIYPYDDQTIVTDFTKTPAEGLVRLGGFPPNAFISLFASEPLLPERKRYELYQRLFRDIPGLHYGLVSGFIYKKRSYHYSVQEEATSLCAFQSIDRQYDSISPYFTEMRTYIEVPSKMWGADVVEVWKFFKRANECREWHKRNPEVRKKYDIKSETIGTPMFGGTDECVAKAMTRETPAEVVLPEFVVKDDLKAVLGAIGFLLVGVVWAIFGYAMCREWHGYAMWGLLGMALGGAFGVFVVYCFLNGVPAVIRKCLLYCRKMILWKSDPAYKHDEPLPITLLIKFIDFCRKLFFSAESGTRTLIHKAIIKTNCYFDKHEPITVKEGAHLLSRCRYCNQFLKEVEWNVSTNETI